MKTKDAALNRWHGILGSLGVDQRFLTGKHTSCPLCGEGKDRFRFDNKEGKGTYYCNECGPGDGLKFAMEWTGLGFPECAKQIDKLVNNAPITSAPAKVIPIDKLQRIFSGMGPVTAGDPVHLYCRNRGIPCPAKYLRYHPNLSYYEGLELVGKFPAMIAAFSDSNGKVKTYHQTYLTSKGYKADVASPKKIASGMVDGGAIRLSPPAEIMGIAEGIETALAARQQYGIPVWSVVSTAMMLHFQPPAITKKLVIFGDNDASYAGQLAAYKLANKLHKEIEVEVRMPEKMGTDFADVIA